jgi:hypothetical protein
MPITARAYGIAYKTTTIMADIKITGLSKIGANAVAMFFESGAFEKAFLESEECRSAKGSGDSSDWDLGKPSVEYDAEGRFGLTIHEITFDN